VTTRAGTGVEDLLRPLAPQVLGVVVRRFGAFERGADAAQEALLAAALRWPEQGIPDNPRGLADHGPVAPGDRRGSPPGPSLRPLSNSRAWKCCDHR
jgi:hypothetical protein